jgi:hypothetical protein
LDSNRWISFDNVGAWGTAYLDRASLSEYIQYGNDASAAKYYDAFTDHNGIPLDGSVVSEYQLTFSKSEIPDATRFWSLTAYIPPGVTLVPNAARKYVVARYTPALQTNSDGSITTYIAPRQPPGTPRANWLPVPRGPFSLLLRVCGPEGNTAALIFRPRSRHTVRSDPGLSRWSPGRAGQATSADRTGMRAVPRTPPTAVSDRRIGNRTPRGCVEWDCRLAHSEPGSGVRGWLRPQASIVLARTAGITI